ncbi:MAG: hypothetical protein M3162_02795, partial [Thermoproteota archaeon]|nr:hypothetical protein [Thermoproteota archaeon]
AGAKLIFLSESCDTGILDSIVDGIITLKREDKSTTVRSLFINKLRGISIDCSKYYFSLFNGLFYVFDSYTDLNALNGIGQNKYGRKSVIKRKNIDKSTSEVKDAISFQNVVSRKNFIVMIFDPRIHADMILPIIMKPMLSWLNSNKKIQINNSKWSFIQRFNLFFEQISSNTVLKNNVLYNNKVFNQECSPDDLDYINNKADPISNEKLSKIPCNTINENNILNVIEMERINRLTSDFKIIELLKNKYFSNLLIIRTPSTDVNLFLLPQSIYYKVFLRGKNILIKTINPIGPTYGTIIENKSCLIDWIPIN